MYIESETIANEGLLIEQAKKDPEKFRVLYEKYHEQLYRFMVRKVIDKELAADLTSDVFLKALVNLKKYKVTKVPFIAWLYRIALNEVRTHFRKSKNQRYVVLDEVLIKNLVSEFGGLTLEEHEVKNQLAKAVQSLKPEEIQLIDLRFFDQKSFKEVSDILGITENNAKVKTYRALDKLKKFYKQTKKS